MTKLPIELREESSRVPGLAALLGVAGLLPQIWGLTMLMFGNPDDRFSALALSYAYAALILSFVGGMWWGLAARAGEMAPRWLWGAAVSPSLIALASAVPWAIGADWPGPSLSVLGIVLIATVGVDHKLTRLKLAPGWWLGLRIPLSVGLGIVTLAIGWFS